MFVIIEFTRMSIRRLQYYYLCVPADRLFRLDRFDIGHQLIDPLIHFRLARRWRSLDIADGAASTAATATQTLAIISVLK
jgi:hypothetical protein